MSKYKWDNLIFFVEQLSSALAMKLPMDKTIHSMSCEALDRGWKRTQEKISEQLASGSSLSDAMEQYPYYFPAMLRQLVRMGEKGNVLPAMLISISRYLQSAREIRHKLQKCLIYPFLVWTFLLVDFVILCFNCLPRFQEMYQQLGSQLPDVTRLFLSFGPAFLILFDGMIFLLAWIVIGWISSDVEGKSYLSSQINRFLRFIPFLGVLQRHANSAEICEVLGVLVEGGHSGRKAIAIAKEAAVNHTTLSTLEELHVAMLAGENYRENANRTVVPHTTLWMLAQSGEQGSQELGQALRNVAAYHRRQLDMLTGVIREVLEPLLLLAVALIGAFALIALYVALFRHVMVIV
ncbi:MAG: hypothetical protein C4527_27195 [Candidatus Omnitrophota bacterium]|jgi:type II secretory pathway component PulF|nr:MAG: hypothetical protein C4527_27195 [Candidatus Omnitrophota bacterium]